MIEDRIADCVRAGIANDFLDGVAAANVLTDVAGYAEWQNEPKIYVIRKSTTILPDLSGVFTEYESEIVLSTMAADKQSAQTLGDALWTFLCGQLDSVAGLTNWVESALDAAPLMEGADIREQYYQMRTVRIWHDVF